MYRAFCAALALAALLAGCDDDGIRDVGRREFVTRKHLADAFAGSSLPVEVHGAPWQGANPEEIAATLRMPEGVARNVHFRAIAPGDPVSSEGERLVLLFNSDGTTSQDAACLATGPLPTTPPPGGSFAVSATFCHGQKWVTYGVMEAEVDATDWLEYYLVMEKLLGRMFPDG